MNINKEKLVAGFSLVETIVVLVIIGILAVAVLLNYRSVTSGGIAREQASQFVISEIRNAQSRALSGVTHSGSIVCGYGIHYKSATSFELYAGNDTGGSCASQNKNYEMGIDTPIKTFELNNNEVEFEASFFDIFYQSPNATTFVNNQNNLDGTISIRTKGEDCAVDKCSVITVYQSGSIDLLDS